MAAPEEKWGAIAMIIRVGGRGFDGASGETWGSIHMALKTGLRGLPSGSSLARLLDKHRR